ncbi:MAG: MSEP-CTERM sorting domain-containing protein [Bacteroidota bacterium]
MLNLLHPRSLLFFNTIPSILLGLLYYDAFDTIQSQIGGAAQLRWQQFALALVLLTAAVLSYAIFLMRRGATLRPVYGIVYLLFYIPCLYLYAYHFETLIPWRTPQWMLPPNLFLYAGSFLMPSMAHALLVILLGITPHPKTIRYNWKNFVLAISIPLAWYFFMEVIRPLWRSPHREYEEHFFIVSLLIGTTLFLLFIARWLYVWAARRRRGWRERELLWKIPLTLLFPFLGLALNQGLLKSGSGWAWLPENLFGDFSHPGFYALTAFNGLLLCLPNPSQPVYRLVLFALRSVTLAFSLYFFLVFVPFLPLSIVAILAMGLGFLLLTPLALLVIHVMDVQRDWQYLQKRYSPASLRRILLLGVLLLPLGITINYRLDRANLHRALDYLYATDYDAPRTPWVRPGALERVLNTVEVHRERPSGDQLSIGRTPFLSHWYNSLVLDNLTLSTKKVNLLRSVFLGERYVGGHFGPSTPRSHAAVQLIRAEVQSEYDTEQRVWRSQVDLYLHNGTDRQREYATSFDLPAGAWVSDYHLWIEGEKVASILAEKKAATWVYRSVTSIRRDPGILYYHRDREVALRVFPLAAQQERRTGFEVLHKEPFLLTIDRETLSLGDTTQRASPIEAIYGPDRKVVYLPSALKAELPRIQRRPHWHFVVDCSEGNDSLRTRYRERIETLLRQHPERSEGARLSLVNTYVQTIPLAGDWQRQLEGMDFSGGFYCDRAFKSILLAGLEEVPTTYPEIVVLSPQFSQAILPDDLSTWSAVYPELRHFGVWEDRDPIHYRTWSPEPGEKWSRDTVPSPGPVLAWPNAEAPQRYLSTAPGPELIFLEPSVLERLPHDTPPRNWKGALQLEGQWRTHQYYPARGDREWRDLVGNSFRSRLLTPSTAYMALENEAQVKALYKKQAQTLKGKQALDAGEDLSNMSEPSFLLCGLVLLLWGAFHYRRIVGQRSVSP